MIPTVVSGLILTKKRRVMEVFSPSLRKLWKEWELQAMAVISLLLQIILIVLGKRRRHIPEIWIRVFVWCAYLLADSVATIALGILSNELGEIYDDGGKLDSKNELTALWAPFFLLHLGGPDTITAYSLEDNELYLRHLFGLILQTMVTGYIFLMAWTGSKHSFLGFPMIVAGSIKYGERTWALWKASSGELQDSMLSSPDHGPNYAKLMDEYSLRHAEGFLVKIEEVKEDQDEPDRTATAPTRHPEENIIKAYTVFEIFKRLFADLILSYQEQEKSQSLFDKMSSEDAFDVIAIELGFVYDMLYTKATVIYTTFGILHRILTFYITCYVLVIFSLDDLGKYKMVDVGITLVLLAGAIWLEIYAALTLLLSDQTKRWLIEHKHTNISAAINRLDLCKVPRWSSRIGQYSLVSLFLNEKSYLRLLKKHRFRLMEKNWFRLFERHGYKSYVPFDEGLGKQIFAHVKAKYKKLVKNKGDHSYLRDLCSQRGKGILADYKEKKIATDLKIEWSVNCEFDESILIWHIATELCYYTEEIADGFKANLEMSQRISRYMLYLLAVYPYMLPAGIGLIRLRDTRAEADKFFEERLSTSDTEKKSRRNTASSGTGRMARSTTLSSDADKDSKSTATTSEANKESRIKACKTLLNVKTHVSPVKVKGDRSKSVLFDACRLASELNTITDKKHKWEMIRDIWLEMLTFAANQCRGKNHAQQLRRGGELLTHVWLLMAHFGTIEQFQISKGHSRALLNKK